MQTVHVRVVDAATNKPIAVRIRFSDAQGRYFPPLGRLASFPTDPGVEVGGSVRLAGRAWSYIDGGCEVRLPPGKIILEIAKGVEYRPLRREVVLAAGQLALRFTLERWIDPRQQGWYSGDIRCHEISPHAALLEGAAEGLAIVQLLARERAESLRNLLAFSGSEAALSSAECLVVVNTLNEHPQLGRVALLDSHRPVYPLRFGGSDGLEDWSVADWCDQCHRKRGLVVWPDLNRFCPDSLQGEALAALVLGKIDAFEVTSLPDPEPEVLGHYYQLLGAGLRPALVGGSGKESNATVLGALRTYARLQPGEPLTASNWAAAVRARRTLVTNGPFLSLTVDTVGPGEVVNLENNSRVRIVAEAQSELPFDQLEVLSDSQILAVKPASGNRQSARLELDFIPSHSTWIAARCYSSEKLETGSCLYAHTAPVWLELPTRLPPIRSDVVEPLLSTLTQTRQWIVSQARCETDKQRNRLLGVIDEAIKQLQLKVNGS